ncbi:hypothetical protein AGMMS49574_17790 [Bacteroidia bacterium]|nr:hypothetical protein AGMMS49574_17790 [Bacteroidia bacterium]
MKQLSKIVLFLLFGWLSACVVLPEDEPIFEDEAPVYFESVTDSAQYTGKEFLTNVLQLAYSDLFASYDIGIRIDVIRYYTTDPKGEKILASGIVAYPVSAPIRSVVMAEHYTIAANHEAPSESKFVTESALALLQYIVITPDFLGFGVSKDVPHPYLHVETTARTSLDMLFAVREYMKQKARPLADDISIIGYSQGAAAALAVQKKAEEAYPDKIHVNKVLAGGGPYDLVAIFDDLKGKGETAYACAVPMTVMGLDYGDNLSLNYAQLFTGSLLENYDEWINSKKYTTGEINDKIGTGYVDQFLHTDFFDYEMEMPAKLYASLVRNSLTDWTPRAPIQLFHGTKDDVVPYACSQNAYDSFKTKGCDVTLTPLTSDHKSSAPEFILYVLAALM